MLALFQEIVASSFVEHCCDEASARFNNSVYTPLVVMWLMLWQRLHGAAPLEAAVLDLLQELPACFWPNPCKRIRDWKQSGKPLSGHSAAYNQARQKLPLPVVEQSCDRIFDQLIARMGLNGGALSRRAFLLDGTSMRTAYSPALAKQFPPGSNQHGNSHWPVVRVLVAHDLQTGLAMRPEWGPMYGRDAVSEQQLLETAIGRLPKGAVIVGDINFGVFSVSWATAQQDYAVALRLSTARAGRLAGEALQDGMDRQATWKPSAYERKAHPDLPAEACVRGRLIVRRVQPENGNASMLLALFTTLPEPAEEILKLYAQRWRIETDLRTLKSQLRLEQLSCATPEMVAKEIEMGIAAYNLVRAVIAVAAEQRGVPPRNYGFTRAMRIVQSFAPKIANASSPADAQRAAKPPRKRKPYPREVYGRGAKFPTRKTS